tara:strand:- start:914 stop:1084 length:171 start_codon:yes stop_codon:yes gene_type:complete
MKTYYITESAIIRKVYSVQANSEEEAKDLIYQGGLDSLVPINRFEEVNPIHQIEEK